MKSIPSIVCGAMLALIAGVCVADDSAAKGKVEVDAKSFRCLTDLHRVRQMYFDNLLGHVNATLKVANSKKGGTYPAGTVIQFWPGEAMVKLTKGASPETHDWEFFNLDVSKDGTKIISQGFAKLEGVHGGFCMGCHSSVPPQYDLVCEADHGCVPIPLTRPMAAALAHTDPRCKNGPPSDEDKAALKQLDDLLKGLK